MGMILIFQKKNCLGQMDHFGPRMAHPHNSGSAVRIFLNFAQWKGPVGRLLSIINLFIFGIKTVHIYKIWLIKAKLKKVNQHYNHIKNKYYTGNWLKFALTF